MITAEKTIENSIHNKVSEHDIIISNLNVSFGNQLVLKNINLSFLKNKVNCIVGPSGSGKSTLLRSINRINNEEINLKVSGSIFFEKDNILKKEKNLTQLRKDIGIVFQSPCIFPKSPRPGAVWVF